MSTERFIARRIVFSNEGKKLISRPVVRIATLGIILGFAVMVIAISVVGGFKKEIREKLTGFSAHIQISQFDRNFSYETTPIKSDPVLHRQLAALPEVRHVQDFATKAGILKKDASLQGVVAKGIGQDYDWTFFQQHLKRGRVFSVTDQHVSNEIILSESVASKLQVGIGDSIAMYFIQQPPRVRKFKICGIYATGFEEFDKLYLFCDIKQIRKLNDWESDAIGGTEIYLKDFKDVDRVTEKVYSTINADLNARSISDLYPQIFDWLQLQDINAIIIITLMILVSGINMISALLVIMLERVNLIGTLKAFGTSDASIRKIFLWVSAYIIGRGILIGNLVGISLVLVQYFFHPLPLDQASYYIAHVPVELNLLHILLLNAGTLFISIAMMLFPAKVIGSIRPVAALRFS